MCQLSVIRGVFKADPETFPCSESSDSVKQEEALAVKTTEREERYVEKETDMESSFSGVVRYRCNLLFRRKP